MDQLTPSLHALLLPFAQCFRPEVFGMFRLLVGSWIVCLGRRTISRLWETTGQAQRRNHSAAFRFFSEAVWNSDEVCRILLLSLVARLVPGSILWLVVDDTLCHKRGAKVAFGGIFLDAVLSSKKYKVLRWGHNWVTLGLILQLPFRPDRPLCVNILWRIYEKKGEKASGHRTKPQLAAEMVAQVAAWLENYQLYVVGDIAYIGRHLLKERPANVHVIGPVRLDAALTKPLTDTSDRRRKKGDRVPTPRQLLADDRRWPYEEAVLSYRQQDKQLHLKQITEVCWYHGAGPQPLQVVLVRDPAGQWRDEVLLCTDVEMSALVVLEGYCRRWSVEVAYGEAKQLLGFHDPQVWSRQSVERAAPMAWLVGALVVLWYAVSEVDQEPVRRERPWYRDKVEPTFADMLATCRWQLWQHWLYEESASEAEFKEKLAWLLEYIATAQ